MTSAFKTSMRAATAICTAVLLVACNGAAVEEPPEAEGEAPEAATQEETDQSELLIGVSLPGINEYVDAVIQAYEEMAADLGNVELQILSADFDVAAELGNVEDLIAAGVDGIIFWPTDPDTGVNVVETILAADIPVVANNNPVGDQEEVYPGLLAFVGRNDVAEAEQIATWISETLGERDANVVMMQGALGSSPQIRREAGFLNVLGDDPRINIVAEPGVADWSTEGAIANMEDIVQRTTDIQVIYNHAPAFATVTAEVARDGGVDMDDLLVTGIDFDTVIQRGFEEGIVDATMYYDQSLEGSEAVRALVEYLREGVEPANRWIQPPAELLTQENFQDYEPTF